MVQGACPGCKEDKLLTVHHLVPISVFGPHTMTVSICRSCHNLLEVKIQTEEKKVLKENGNPKRKRARKDILYQNLQLYYDVYINFIRQAV